MRKALADHTDLDVLADIQAGADYLRGQSFVKADGIADVRTLSINVRVGTS